MTKKIIGLLYMIAICAISPLYGQKNTQPNVLTIIIDDAGWKDVGYHGGTIATPEIDKLANDGTRLTSFYTYSTCTPSRVALLTGRAPSRSGLVYPIQHDDNFGIPQEVETLSEVFQKNKYRTAIIGKWHLGVKKEFQPNANGFDYQYGNLGGWIDQYTRVNPNTGYDWTRNGNTIDDAKGHATDIITNEAIKYINDNRSNPFFMYLSYTAPHVPIQVDSVWTKPYQDKFDSKTRIGYAGMMAHLDFSIGRVIKTLEENKMLENTIIVFLSDNGPSAPGKKWYIDEKDFSINFYGNNGEYGDRGYFRGWKAQPYDGGVRVPAFIYWKGQMSNAEWEKPVIIQDLYPTILGLAKLDMPKQYNVEARDIFSSKETAKFYWRTPVNIALRHGQWKLVVLNNTPHAENLDAQLYNMEVDMSESKDLSQKNPEKMNELLALMKQEFDKDPKIHINKNLLDK